MITCTMRVVSLLITLVLTAQAERTTEDDLAVLEFEVPCPRGSFSFDGWGYNTEEYPCELCGEGEFGGEEEQDECGVCPAGSYTPDAGFWECLQCPQGFIADQEFSVECYPCYLGQFSPVEGGTSCENCPTGTYQDTEGAGSCKTCPAGSYQDTPASDSCNLCSAGYSSPAGSEAADACTPCSAGSYSPDEGSECLPCPVKTYNDVIGAVSCKECPSNTDTEGSTECKVEVECADGEIEVDGVCTPCQAGSFEQDKACKPCPAGSFSATTMATQCQLCPSGSFSGTDGSAQCDACPQKTYGPSPGLSKCLECPGNAIEGMTECKVECPPGQVEDDDGNCVACTAGTYQDGEECVVCPGGRYSETDSAVACQACPSGKYCTPGTSSPIICPTGSFCPSEAADPSLCSAGTYNPETGSESPGSCLLCPGGFYCDSEGQEGTSGACTAGYFCPEGSTSSEQDACPPGSYCPQKSVSPTPCPKNTFLPSSKGTEESSCQHCPPGYETDSSGAASADSCKEVICDPGFYKDMDEGCVFCPAGSYSTVQNAPSCTPCAQNSYNSVEGSTGCLMCPDTAYTWNEGTDSFDKCIGPVIEVCTEKELGGTCNRYYDDNLQVNYDILSLQVIRGEFEVFTAVNHGGDYSLVKETDGALNVEEIFHSHSDETKIMSFKPILNDVYCYFEKGVNFRGSFRTTASNGKPCINWSRTPMADKALHNNYCQNPDAENPADEPFCYTSATETSPCGIPACLWDIICYTGIGSQYRGTTSTTDHSKTCQNWESDWPHPHTYHQDEYAWAGIGDHNFCRNPDKKGTGKTWCYTTSLNPYYWWDYCDVERCNRDQFDFYQL